MERRPLTPTDKSEIKTTDLDTLRSILIQELPDHKHALQTAVDLGNYRFLYDTAHKIAGGSIYCELLELEQAARALQETLLGEESHDAIDTQTQQLLSEIDNLLVKESC